MFYNMCVVFVVDVYLWMCCCVQVKMHHATGKSRGFGFVRFSDPAVQYKVQSMQHTIKDRRVDIKHPRKVHMCSIFMHYYT